MVVTIVVLLILAGVSISLILDNNGIIQKSKEARREYGASKANEQAQMDNVADWIDESIGKVAKIDVNTKASKNGTINGEKGDLNNPTIPKGYTPINTDTSSWGDGSSTPSQDSVNHGLVIRDDSNNEWVWVPVDSAILATIYETSSDEKILCGTEGKTAVTTNKYSKKIMIGKDNNTRTLTRNTPGTVVTRGWDNYREPDLVIDYDAKEQYYKEILGFESKEKMAEVFVADYNEMVTSIEKYGGFYIGRYELSGTVAEPTEKSGKTITNTNWYNLYNACRSSKLQASDKVKTQMIWGCQWDLTCNFIANKGDQKNIKDSRSWGNYSNSIENAAVTVTENEKEIKKYGSEQDTGYSEYWKANNIYDLAGNCVEWTQEADNSNNRACRGGWYSNTGSVFSASYRGGYPTNYVNDYDFRHSSNFNNKVVLNLTV